METLGKGDTMSDKIFPQGSSSWSTHGRRVWHCLNISTGRVPEGEECTKPPEKWWMAVQTQRPSKGTEERRKTRTLKIPGDIVKYLSHHQAKKSVQKPQHCSHPPEGEQTVLMCLQAQTLVPTPALVAKCCSTHGLVSHPRQSTAKLHAGAGGIPEEEVCALTRKSLNFCFAVRV